MMELKEIREQANRAREELEDMPKMSDVIMRACLLLQ